MSKYNNKRSLCFNIATAIGMTEDDMRTAVNAQNHIKFNKDNRMYDIIRSYNGNIIMISLLINDNTKDYMISSINEPTNGKYS